MTALVSGLKFCVPLGGGGDAGVAWLVGSFEVLAGT